MGGSLREQVRATMGTVGDQPAAGFHFEARQGSGGGQDDGDAQIEGSVQAGLDAPDKGFGVGAAGAQLNAQGEFGQAGGRSTLTWYSTTSAKPRNKSSTAEG